MVLAAGQRALRTITWRHGTKVTTDPPHGDALSLPGHAGGVPGYNPGVWMNHRHNLPHAGQGMAVHLAHQDVITSFHATYGVDVSDGDQYADENDVEGARGGHDPGRQTEIRSDSGHGRAYGGDEPDRVPFPADPSRPLHTGGHGRTSVAETPNLALKSWANWSWRR